jgi:predicted amidohydrolase YtcJ
MILDGAPTCALCMTYWQTAVASWRAFAGAVRDRSLDPIRTSLAMRPRFGREVRSGLHLHTAADTGKTIRAATERGFSVACHAEGNDAIGRALTAYEDSSARLHGGGQARLEHVLFADRALSARIARVGAAAVMQPFFLSIPTVASAPEVPGLPLIPLRSLIDAGVTVAGSSDFPVTGFDPLDGIRSAVSRKCGRGVREAAEKVSIDEAFAMYTREAASVLGCLDECGTLEPGKRADLVFLDRRVQHEDDLAEATVARTVLEGRAVFGA